MVEFNFIKTIFFNYCFDKRRFSNFLQWFFRKNGHQKLLHLLEKLKFFGFHSATEAGFSISIEDLKIPELKSTILFNSVTTDLTPIENYQQILELWNHTNQTLTSQVIQSFQISDFLNPVYLMAFSGARGNISQIRQLVSMRGLMADPQGQIIDFPIRSNFREGLTLTEYLISCSGARKGIVDTALRTAASGYLTRRLVDVAHHVIISQIDCESNKGFLLESLYDQKKKILSLEQRLIGRILAETIVLNGLKIMKNQEVSKSLSMQICHAHNKVLIRSPLTCLSSKFICQLCYGWNLAEGQLVSIGEAVGILAAQSIGEPGTQLTMRTFHTGGVFTGTVMDQTYSPCPGYVSYPCFLNGLLIRTQQGQIAYFTKNSGTFKIQSLHNSNPNHERFLFLNAGQLGLVRGKNPFLVHIFQSLQIFDNFDSKHFVFPNSTILYLRQGEHIRKGQLLAEVPFFTNTFEKEQEVLSPVSGEIFFENLVLFEKTRFDSKKFQFAEIWLLFGQPTPQFLFKKLDLIAGYLPFKQIELPHILKNEKTVLYFKNISYYTFSELNTNFELNTKIFKIRKQLKQNGSRTPNQFQPKIVHWKDIPLQKYIFIIKCFPRTFGCTNTIKTLGFYAFIRIPIWSNSTSENRRISENSSENRRISKFFIDIQYPKLQKNMFEKRSKKQKHIIFKWNFWSFTYGKSRISWKILNKYCETYDFLLMNFENFQNHNIRFLQNKPKKCVYQSSVSVLTYPKITDIKYKKSKKTNSQTFQIIQKNYFRSCKIQIFTRFFKYFQNSEILDLRVSQKQNLFSTLSDFVARFGNDSTKLGAVIPRSGQYIARIQSNKNLYRKATNYLLNNQSILYGHYGKCISQNERLCTVFYNQPKTGDIVQGIPKIEQILEVRKNILFKNVDETYLPNLQKSVINNIQRIYGGQGIYISDKHIEIIVRQMTANALILEPGQTGLLCGEIVGLQWIERINSTLMNKVLYEPILMGMTQTCLEMSSFLSAASFQETTRVLSRAALQNQIDFIRGIKQNVILGNLIPIGTGCF